MSERLPLLKLPLASASIRRQYHQALRRVLEKGALILGSEVSAFEQEFSRFCAARECVSVGNGTDALQIALRVSGVAPGRNQEVICTPLTASFTAHAIVAAGAKPVFADIDPDTLLMRPDQVASAIGPRTAALLPVHLYGQVCDLAALRKLASRFDLALLQDAAQAHGSLYKGRPLAAFTDICCYSFYPTKNLGALGDGGALITNSKSLARSARLIRDGGREGSHVAQVEAVNSRLDELQAAFLRLHLQHLSAWNRHRAEMAALYDYLLDRAGIPELCPVGRAKDSTSYYHLYVIRVRGRSCTARRRLANSNRDALRQFLASGGIETALHYEHPLHLQPAFQRFGYTRGDFPQAELACREICSLPMHPFLSRRDVERVVRMIRKFFSKQIANRAR